MNQAVQFVKNSVPDFFKRPAEKRKFADGKDSFAAKNPGCTVNEDGQVVFNIDANGRTKAWFPARSICLQKGILME